MRTSPAERGIAGARCPRDSRQDAGGTTQGAAMKAAAPMSLFSLPMILHGRDAPAEAGLPAHTEVRDDICVTLAARRSKTCSLAQETESELSYDSNVATHIFRPCLTGRGIPYTFF